MPTTIVTAPTQEPVTLAEAKDWCRVVDDESDADLRAVARAAREYVETVLHRVLITQTWNLILDDFSNPIELPYPPLQSVSHIKYYNTDGDQKTLADTVYTVSTDHEPGRITLTWGQSWPSLYGIPDQIEIQYVCGYGDTPGSVPAMYKMAMRQLISHWNEYREPIIVGAVASRVALTVDALLGKDRIFGAI